ncbi:hypothetical protein [Streptomyces sp. NRRL S-350]|uniref:hypothetical protein n=1 Tax=Streptomyces sp. NRRL S-350 TaxID=1463902 RepID=UPI0004C1700A|nr:hypothetical protein [Streptomyces sp. NRRL S-350]
MATSTEPGTPLGRLLDELAGFVRARVAERTADPERPAPEREHFTHLLPRLDQVLAHAHDRGALQQLHALRLFREMSLLWYGHDEHPDNPWLEQLATTDPEAALRQLRDVQDRVDRMTD